MTEKIEEKNSQDGRKEDNNRKGSPFQLEDLRLPQDFTTIAGVKKQVVTIPVCKPHRQAFVRVRQEESWRFETFILEFERQIYLVDRPLWDLLSGEIRPAVVFTAIDTQGRLFLWPIPLPDPDGRHNVWHASALEAARIAMESWVRVQSNRDLGRYEVGKAIDHNDDPEWPDLSFEQALQIAFKDQFIKSMDHPVVKKLSGQL